MKNLKTGTSRLASDLCRCDLAGQPTSILSTADFRASYCKNQKLRDDIERIKLSAHSQYETTDLERLHAELADTAHFVIKDNVL